jgi:hypothetical protein
MTGFARYVAPVDRRITNDDLTGLAGVVNQCPEKVRTTFLERFRAMQQIPNELEQRIADTANPLEKSRLEQQRTNFNFHVPFDYDSVRQYLRASVDR